MQYTKFANASKLLGIHYDLVCKSKDNNKCYIINAYTKETNNSVD